MSEHRAHCLEEQKALKATGMFYELGEPCICNAPKRIWLQVDPEGERYDDPLSGWDGATWCEDRMNTTDVEYVRADTLEKNDDE